MKRYKYFGILLLLPLLFLTSCVGKGFTIESVGKDEFDEYSGEFELGLYILPTDDFMTRFPHTDEVYHFLGRYKHKLSILGEETLIITAQYEPDVYEEAKEFCLQSMTLQEVEVPDYNGYHFIENTKLGANPDGDQDNSSNFPWLYNMFAYNDTECKLAFMGYHSPYLTTKETDRMKIINGWPEFIEELFPEIGKGGLAQG